MEESVLGWKTALLYVKRCHMSFLHPTLSITQNHCLCRLLQSFSALLLISSMHSAARDVIDCAIRVSSNVLMSLLVYQMTSLDTDLFSQELLCTSAVMSCTM